MKYFVIYFLASIFINQVVAQPLEDTENAYPLHRAQSALTDVIVHDVFSPPVATRIYAYANIAAYQVLSTKYSQDVSLQKILRKLPVVNAPKENYSASLAAVYAFLITGKQFVFSEQQLEDSMQQILQWFGKQKISSKVYQTSVKYGKQMADSIIKWASNDNYRETRKLPRYRLLKQTGKWLPTPPGYMAAVEPYWGRIRTLMLDSASQCKIPAPPAFSTEKNSAFYKSAAEVYETSKTLTEEQNAKAGFWDCNPFYLNNTGHLNFATKKISPGGHWMSITAIACNKAKAGIFKSSAAYTYAALALFDGFICCWDEKYRSNLIRPESYINSYMDESWRPILQTPPFPEYPSGHSVISAAASTVLTYFFGDNFSFDDTSEIPYGLPVRNFSSFKAAADEAAISRLYGGIHYREAIELGNKQGNEVGDIIVAKMKQAFGDVKPK